MYRAIVLQVVVQLVSALYVTIFGGSMTISRSVIL